MSNPIEKVVVNLLGTDGTFYASLLTQMNRIETKQIPTAGVTIRKGRMELYWNPEFFDKLTVLQAKAVLEHECMHLVMEHILRLKDRDPEQWNLATDLAINQMIQNLPTDCVSLDKFPRDWKMPPKAAADIYYEIIKKNQKKIYFKISGCNCGKGNGQQNNQNGNDQNKQNQGKCPKCGGGRRKAEFFDEKGNKIGECELDSPGDHGKWNESDDPDVAREVLRQSVRQAKEETEKSRGTIPAGLEEYVNELLKPPAIPWQQVLRQWIANHIKGGHKQTWKRPNRRYGSEQKGKIPTRVLTITFAIDTSGSMSNEDLQDAIVELKGILRAYKTTITVLECDAKVHSEYKLTQHTKVNIKFLGRGGTAFEPVFDYVEDEKIHTDLLIYFTDLYGSFPATPPRYPTLWVSTANEKEVPFGKVLSLPEAKTKKRG